jgi:2-hydroxy-3-oxopropionate reductase
MKPYLQLMGTNIVHIGGNGDGQVCKAANQIVVAATLQGVAEALVLASKAGADPAKVREALLGGFAQSKVLEVHGDRMLKRTFSPGFRVNLHRKDLNLALQTARELGVSLPNTALVQELLNSVAANEGADLDHSVIITALERLANHEVG